MMLFLPGPCPLLLTSLAASIQPTKEPGLLLAPASVGCSSLLCGPGGQPL